MSVEQRHKPDPRRGQRTSVIGAILYLLPAMLFFGNSLVIEVLRPRYQKPPGNTVAFVLGWLPNAISGLGFMALGLAALRLAVEYGQGRAPRERAHHFMAGVAGFSLLGLVGWELSQIHGRLVFDVNDMVASVGGVLAGYALFALARRYDPVLATRDRRPPIQK